MLVNRRFRGPKNSPGRGTCTVPRIVLDTAAPEVLSSPIAVHHGNPRRPSGIVLLLPGYGGNVAYPNFLFTFIACTAAVQRFGRLCTSPRHHRYSGGQWHV